MNDDKTPTIIFPCADSNDEATNAIIAMLTDQVMQIATETASHTSNKRLPRNWLAILDELTNYPKIKNLSK